MRLLNYFIEAYSSIWYGIIAAVVIVAALFFVIASMQGGNKRFTPLSYILGIALGAFLTFQCASMIGAIMFKSDCYDTAAIVDDFTPNSELRQDSKDIRKELRRMQNDNPFIENFIDIDEIDENLPDGAIGTAALSKVHTYLNWYIFRRILWSLLACGIGVLAILYTMERTPRGRTRKTPGYRSSRNRRHISDDF